MVHKRLAIFAGFIAVYCAGLFVMSSHHPRPTVSFVRYMITPEGGGLSSE